MSQQRDDRSGLSSADRNQILSVRPCLNQSVSIVAHQYRGETWSVYEDQFRGTFYRLEPTFSRLLQGADGSQTLEQLLRRLSPDELNALGVNQLHTTLKALIDAELLVDKAGLLVADFQSAGDSGGQHSTGNVKSLVKTFVANPFAMKFGLWNPDAFLNRLFLKTRFVFTWPFAVLSLLLVSWFAFQVPVHWQALQQHFSARFVDASNLLSLLLLYPLIKLIHECAHGLAIKQWRGYVKEAGISLLIFFPVPYVDASASSRFASKYQRMAVSGAGIWVELVLASLAFIAWLHCEQGLLKDLAFNVVLLSAGSTLLFNANPLLRFDGYYILSDWIEMPNLNQRASRHWGGLLRRYWLGLKGTQGPLIARGERRWLLTYGLAAYIYRLGLAFVIAAYLATQFFWLGMVLAIWMLFVSVVRPLYQWWRSSWSAAETGEQSSVVFRAGVGLLAALILLFSPWPHRTQVTGIVQVSDQAIVRALADGEVSVQNVRSGQAVEAGDAILQLSNPELESRVLRLQAELEEAELRQARALSEDLSEMAMFAERAAGLRRELEAERAELSRLSVTALADGTFTASSYRDREASWVKKGDLLGYIESDVPRTVVISVDSDQIKEIRRGFQTIDVYSVGGGAPKKGKIIGLTPQATDRLPSALLGTHGGGDIATDQRDSSGLTSMGYRFTAEIQLHDTSLPVTGRTTVQFDHGSRNLVTRGMLFVERYWFGNMAR